MSKLETNTIDTISGSTTLTLGGTNATTIAQDSATTVTGFKSTGIDDNADQNVITITTDEKVGINETSPIVSFDVGTTGGGQIRYGFGSTIIDGGTLSTGNADDYKTSGFYRFNSGVTNIPSATIYAVVVFGNGSNVVTQIATRIATTLTYVRSFNTSWSAWQRLDT